MSATSAVEEMNKLHITSALVLFERRQKDLEETTSRLVGVLIDSDDENRCLIYNSFAKMAVKINLRND